MTNIPLSDSSNLTQDALTISGTGSSGSTPSVAEFLPTSIPGPFFQGSEIIQLSYVVNNPGIFPIALPGAFNGINYAAAPTITGIGWELIVRSHDQFAMLAHIPYFESLSIMKELSNEGSGQVVLDYSSSVFQTTTYTGTPGSDLLAYENVWQCLYNGEVVFEFFGETIDTMETDYSTEAQAVTISGPGTARALTWAQVLPPGFPNIVYKVSSLQDDFSTKVINTTLWNTTSLTALTSDQIYVDTSTGAAAIAPESAPTQLVLSAGNYNAIGSSFSASITPMGFASSPANLITNGSFSSGKAGWAGYSGGNVTPYTADSSDGDGFCMLVQNNSIAQAGAVQTISNLQANTTYQVSGWIKVISGTSQPTMTVYDTTNSVNAFSTTVSVSNQWVFNTTTITTGASGPVTLNVIFVGTASLPGIFLVDDVSAYVGTLNSNTSLYLQSSTNSNYYAMIELQWGISFAAVVGDVSGQTLEVMSPYDAVQHKYWRIREFGGTFYFDASPDGSTWTNYVSIPHVWNCNSVTANFSGFIQGTVPAGTTPAEIMDINGGSSGTTGLENSYTEVPNVGGIFLDLLQQAQTRGTIPFIIPTFTNVEDSTGIPWNDQASMEISSGADLESQLEASVTAIDGDWIMLPNFMLSVGTQGALGNDYSGTIVFYQSGQITSHESLKVRDQIANYVVAADTSGNVVLQTDSSSASNWLQREQYVSASSSTTVQTLQNLANAALLEFKDEQVQRTISIPPDLPGRTAFKDFDVADWISFQDLSLSTTDKVRVVAIAVSIDNAENVTIELTLETRIQLLIERMNTLLQKIGSALAPAVLPAPGSASQMVTSVANTASATSYTQIIGDGHSTAFTIAHGLGTYSVFVAVWNLGPPVTSNSSATVTVLNTEQIQVNFGAAPAANSIRVVITS